MGAPDPDPGFDRRFRDALAQGAASEVVRLTDELQRQGRYAACRERLEQAWDALPSEPRIAARLLEMLQRYHRWRRFDEVAVAALDAHPAAGELWFTVGCGHEGRGAWQEAWEAFGRAAALAPDELEPVLRMARAYRMARRVDDAVRVLTAALRRHGRHAPLHAALGYAWIQAQEPERAVDCFRKAIERQPDWDPYLDDLAGALMLCERWQEAARAARASLERRRRNERAWTVYAISHSRLGDARRAEQGYRNAIRAARNPARAQGNYGLYLSRYPKRLLEAARLLKQAYDAHPDWEEVASRLARITDPQG
jgi:tetratricopeptide (TPR) repeat protein